MDALTANPPDPSTTRDDAGARREEVLHLLGRAASALIDAEDHGRAWAGYGGALERARAFKAQADRLGVTLQLRR